MSDMDPSKPMLVTLANIAAGIPVETQEAVRGWAFSHNLSGNFKFEEWVIELARTFENVWWNRLGGYDADVDYYFAIDNYLDLVLSEINGKGITGYSPFVPDELSAAEWIKDHDRKDNDNNNDKDNN